MSVVTPHHMLCIPQHLMLWCGTMTRSERVNKIKLLSLAGMCENIIMVGTSESKVQVNSNNSTELVHYKCEEKDLIYQTEYNRLSLRIVNGTHKYVTDLCNDHDKISYVTSKTHFFMYFSTITPVGSHTPKLSIKFLQNEPHSWVDIELYSQTYSSKIKKLLLGSYFFYPFHLLGGSRHKVTRLYLKHELLISFQREMLTETKCTFSIEIKTTDENYKIKLFPESWYRHILIWSSSFTLSKSYPIFLIYLFGNTKEITITNQEVKKLLS